MPDPTRLPLSKLSDHFGQYELLMRCTACLHERRTFPSFLARIFGWDTSIDTLTNRLRCSKCGKKCCKLEAVLVLRQVKDKNGRY